MRTRVFNTRVLITLEFITHRLHINTDLYLNSNIYNNSILYKLSIILFISHLCTVLLKYMSIKTHVYISTPVLRRVFNGIFITLVFTAIFIRQVLTLFE